MSSSRRVRTIAAISAVAVLAVLTGCQVSAAGRRCRGTGVAQDATHVLQCRNGRYVRWMTKADGLRLLAAIQAARAGTANSGAPTAGPGVPTGSRSVPPIDPAAAQPAGSAWGAVGCYDGNANFSDVWYTGVEDVRGNVAGSNSRNGTCSEGPQGFALTVVRSVDQTGAIVKCQSIVGLGGAFRMSSAGYAFPTDAWGCE